MRVAIDQALCRGDCICELICPQVFVLDSEGIAHVSQDGQALVSGGPQAWAEVPGEAEALVLDAARECPAEAIFVEQ